MSVIIRDEMPGRCSCVWPRVSHVPSPERISRNLTIITEPAADVRWHLLFAIGVVRSW